MKTTVDYLKFRTRSDPFAILEALRPGFGSASDLVELGQSVKGKDGWEHRRHLKMAGDITIGANGVLTAGANQVQTSDVGLGQIARNGIYYVGDLNNPLVRGFNVSPTGVLTAIAGSPFSTPGGGSLAALDPTESLVYSAPNGTGLAGSRRLSDNTLTPAANSPVTDNMNNVFVFDFFSIVFQQ